MSVSRCDVVMSSTALTALTALTAVTAVVVIAAIVVSSGSTAEMLFYSLHCGCCCSSSGSSRSAVNKAWKIYPHQNIKLQIKK